MGARVMLSWSAAIVAVVATILLATADVRAGALNCGSALFPRDAAGIVIRTDDPVQDGYAQSLAAQRCDREILRRRALALTPLALWGVGWGVVALRRAERRRRRELIR